MWVDPLFLNQSRVRVLAIAALTGASMLLIALPSWAQLACGSQSVLDLVPSIRDVDGDQVGDGSDNCTLVFNPEQVDADSDGYGNICDADFNNDGAVGADDMGIALVSLGSTNAVVDLNSDGAVGGDDLGLFLEMLGDTPGPSGLGCAGTGAVPCTAF
jgi:hypothetical protein